LLCTYRRVRKFMILLMRYMTRSMYISRHILSVATWDVLGPRLTDNKPCPEWCDKDSLNLREF